MILLYIAEGLSKLCVITSTYLHTQEVLEDSLEYVSILYVQKLCHVCLANSSIVSSTVPYKLCVFSFHTKLITCFLISMLLANLI